MSRRSERNSAGKVEPDRVGKMHARRRELSVRAQLARRLRGFRGRTGRVGSRPSWSGGRRLQRVIVKTHVARHKPGKARGSLMRHASYLGRDSASADGKPGVFYDASRSDVNGKEEVAVWGPDRHHFRIIISPERGADIPDMTAYVREVMARVEKDLAVSRRHRGQAQSSSGSRINHHNTDNPACACRASRQARRWPGPGDSAHLSGARNARTSLGSGHGTARRAHGRTGPGSALEGG